MFQCTVAWTEYLAACAAPDAMQSVLPFDGNMSMSGSCTASRKLLSKREVWNILVPGGLDRGTTRLPGVRLTSVYLEAIEQEYFQILLEPRRAVHASSRVLSRGASRQRHVPENTKPTGGR